MMNEEEMLYARAL